MEGTCRSCGHLISTSSKFCGSCGKLVDQSLEYTDPFKSKQLWWIFIYYGCVVFLNLIFSKITYFEPLQETIIVDSIFIVLTLLTLAFNYNGIKELLYFKEVKIGLLLLCSIGAILFSIIVNLVISPLNIWLTGNDINYYYTYSESSHPVLFLILSVALMPAIFEELSFRGVILNHLLLFTNKQTSLIICSLLFAIIHLTFISMIWLLPFALIIGWFRLKYNTLWYGIIIHFTFNLTTCLIDIYKAGAF